jgi:hypothetical protein
MLRICDRNVNTKLKYALYTSTVHNFLLSITYVIRLVAEIQCILEANVYTIPSWKDYNPSKAG